MDRSDNHNNWVRLIAIVAVPATLVALLLFVVHLAQAQGSPNLEPTPITWNVVGLDSNNVNVGPSNFPVGVRVCKTGSAAATNVTATFIWDDERTHTPVTLTSTSVLAP